MSDPLLEARGLSKTYRTGPRRIDVLRGLDLSIEAGEAVAIVGESGVGKSTLLHMLGGLDQPDAGQLRFAGEPIPTSGKELAEYRNRRVGFVFQFHYLLPEFTAIENVEMPFRLAGLRGGFRDRARALLERLGLEDRLDHHPGTLSGGEQQRVAIARAVVAEPDLVLADEPTGNLDPNTAVVVFETLAKLQRERGFAMLLATHNERLARECNRVLRMEQGGLRPLNADEARAYFEGLAPR
jgi:lipoprotein-releasing system ATP-binding protein